MSPFQPRADGEGRLARGTPSQKSQPWNQTHWGLGLGHPDWGCFGDQIQTFNPRPAGNRETRKTVSLVTTFRITPKNIGEEREGRNYHHNRSGFKPPCSGNCRRQSHLSGDPAPRGRLPGGPSGRPPSPHPPAEPAHARARAGLRAPAGRGPARRVPDARSRPRPSESHLQLSPSALRPLAAASDYCLWRSP